MAYKLMITQKAEDDLDAILGYIFTELKNPEAAAHLMDEIDHRYEHLENNPSIYAECMQPLLKPMHYRKVVIGGYLMIFRVDEEAKTVFVERFFSGLEEYAEKL
ncbi:MAG: type II toxin-antitoxin system RelE/ParE family toxin [Candidatus Limiplasma sp.]|nr:type II toxin-antitoxin system RelE/ParE family toxin [Candidatus Limiplasma sp.]